jgi:RNA polymerase sigma-70 factor (ECF subfamily)
MKGRLSAVMDRTDEDIMQACQAGDRDAFREIFQRYKSRIVNFCLRMLGNRADAEDVAGDVFVAILENCQTYNSQARFSTWAYTIARNKCVSRMRRRGVSVAESRGGEERSWEIPDQEAISREILDKKEAAIRVQGAIAQLPYEQREALVLRQYHGFSYGQISQIMDCSLDKVKILIFRAKERLRIDLASFVQEEHL